MPAFNDQAYLAEALDSLAAQTFADFEVVVSDDASEDGTAGIAEARAAGDSRVRVLRNARNLGMTENWNRALGEARGELVFKLDADDALEPEALARLLTALDESPRIRFAACRSVECDEQLRPLRPYHGEGALRAAGLDPEEDRTIPGWRWFDLSFDDAQLWHSSAQLHRRQDLLATEGWDATWSCASDTDLLLRATATRRPVAHSSYVGVRYRRRPGSVSARFAESGWKQVEATLVALRALQTIAPVRARLVPRLRRNWWRLAQNLSRLDRDPGLWRTMPERVREKLGPVRLGISPPPASVRFEGRLRDALWLRRQRRGRGS